MKSVRLPSGSTYFAHEHNALRSDAAASAWLHVHQQLGALALGTNPSNNQTVTLDINGTNVVCTAVTSIGATAGNFLIGASAAATVSNLYNLLINPTVTTSTGVALSSANAILVQYLGWDLPSGGTTITPFSLNTSTYAPLTSFSASTTVTSGSWTGQTMQLYVEPGSYYIGTTRVLYLGGSTPTITAPSSHPRIDLITADSSGTIALVTGTENASPVAPSYPANKLVLAEIYNVVGETALYDNDYQQSGQGYVYKSLPDYLFLIRAAKRRAPFFITAGRRGCSSRREHRVNSCKRRARARTRDGQRQVSGSYWPELQMGRTTQPRLKRLHGLMWMPQTSRGA